MAVTYLSAKKAGFTGAYSDWISAGRPHPEKGDTFGEAPVEPTPSAPTPTATSEPTPSGGTDTNFLNWFDKLTGGGETYPDYKQINEASSALTNDAYRTLTQRLIKYQEEWDSKLRESGYTEWKQGNISFDEYKNSIQALDTYYGSAPSAVKTRYESFKNSEISKGAETIDNIDEQERRMAEARYLANQSGATLTSNDILSYAETGNSAALNTAISGEPAPSAGTTDDGSYNTYLNARNNGFTGDFNAWVSAGRPSSGDPAGTDAGAGTAAGTGVDAGGDVEGALKSIDDAVAKGLITSDIGNIFKRVVRNWDISKELNMDSVLQEFNKIKNETIDPFYREQVSQIENDLRTSKQFLDAERERELEVERFGAGENIRQAQSGLEKAGMTFTGKGIEQLGAGSAFAQSGVPNVDTMTREALIDAIAEREGMSPDHKELLKQQTDDQLRGRIRNFIGDVAGVSSATTASGLPTQIPFGGAFHEGTVNQANRLLASGSSARYQANLEQMARQAEGALGSAGLAGLTIPDLVGQGDVTQGAISGQQQQAYANVLSQLSGQQNQNISYQDSLNLF